MRTQVREQSLWGKGVGIRAGAEERMREGGRGGPGRGNARGDIPATLLLLENAESCVAFSLGALILRDAFALLSDNADCAPSLPPSQIREDRKERAAHNVRVAQEMYGGELPASPIAAFPARNPNSPHTDYNRPPPIHQTQERMTATTKKTGPTRTAAPTRNLTSPNRPPTKPPTRSRPSSSNPSRSRAPLLPSPSFLPQPLPLLQPPPPRPPQHNNNRARCTRNGSRTAPRRGRR